MGGAAYLMALAFTHGQNTRYFFLGIAFVVATLFRCATRPKK